MTPDELEAARDAIAIAAGAELANPHPMASSANLRRVAEHFAARSGRSFSDDRARAAVGMSSSDFGRLLANGLLPAIIVGFERQASHRVFCAPLEAENFRPVVVPSVDAEVELLPVGEHAEITTGIVSTGAGLVSASLASFARSIRLSRHLIVNDERGALRGVAMPIGPSAARLEAKMLCDALEAGTTTQLDDSAVVFDAAFDNIQAAALDATTLAAAMGKLRTQRRAAGGYADLSLAHLVVEAALELPARKLLLDHGLADRVTLTALPWLASGRWYAFADPRIAPVAAYLHLRGSAPEAPPVRIEPKKAPTQVDGIALRASADLGVALLGRIGVVRGGA